VKNGNTPDLDEGTEEPAATPEPDDFDGGFDTHAVDPNIKQGLLDLGYEALMPVQVACLDVLRTGRSLSIRSKTGTGKTAAIGIPLLEALDMSLPGPNLLILGPTRELAGQICAELSAIGKHRGLKVMAAYGGAPIGAQKKAIADGVHVVVGTPGRLLDLMRQKVLKLENIRAAVLDEADEMLSMGFFEDVTTLLDNCTQCKQYVLLSASLSEEVDALIDRYASERERIDLSVDKLSLEGIANVYYKIGEDLPHHHYLLHVMAVEKPESAIVFVNTRKDATLVASYLAREGIKAEMISGELPQTERERVMAAIRAGELRVLVATDLAARGIDISDLSHVINYNLPEEAAIYLHRIGRTGRVGKKGTAVSLVTGRRRRTLGELERSFGIKFEEREFPTAEQMTANRNENQLADLWEKAEPAICDGYMAQAKALLEHDGALQMVAYLLKSHADMVHDQKRSKENRPKHDFPRRSSGGGGSGGGRRPSGGRPGGGSRSRGRKR